MFSPSTRSANSSTGDFGPAKASRSGKKPAAEADAPPRITAPASGTIIALDPDIPPKNQRISFSAEGRGTRWIMDGKEFARGPQAQWLPWPGRHVVQLVDAGGKVADEIRFEVRGAGVRQARAVAAGTLK